MLYDFEKGCSIVDPDALKRSDIYKKFESVTHPKTITATFNKLHNFIDDQKPSMRSQLVWIRLAKMFGRNSATPHKDICYLEDVVFNAVGGDKSFLMLAGTLLMICVAERQGDTWLTSKTSETEKFYHNTGKEIAYRSYWIDIEPPRPKGTWIPD